MGFYSGNTTLQKRRDGSWSNSTKTCRIEASGSRAWSYRERIFVKVKDVYFFNDGKFSSTTSGHQNALDYFLRTSLVVKNVLYFDVSTLNGIEPSVSKQEAAKVILSRLEKPAALGSKEETFLKKFAGAKAYSSKVAELEKLAKLQRKTDNENKRIAATKRKLKKLDFKTIQGFERALSRYKNALNLDNMTITCYPSTEKLFLYRFAERCQDFVFLFLYPGPWAELDKKQELVETLAALGD